MKRIPYGKHLITPEDLKALNETLLSDFITQGPKVSEFEEAFAAYIGVKYAVAVNNGTAALDISVKSLALKPGEKVVTTPITFVASANAVRFSDGEVIFSDIDRDTYLLDLNKLESTLKSHQGTIKGVIPVDFAGYPVNLEDLRTLADKYGFWILEDACHAPGGGFTDSKGELQKCGNGNFTECAIFSFHPVKHIATGEGGMVTTNDPELYKRLLLYRNHGITKDDDMLLDNHGGWYYEMHELSHNYRLTDFQAALGLSQLQRADQGLARRREIASIYDEAFKNIPEIKIPLSGENISHAYHLYVIQVPDRKRFYDFLISKGIFAQIHYIPAHLMPYYQRFGWKKGDMPVAEDYYEHCISLPEYPTLTREEQEYVISNVLDFFNS